MKVLVTGSQGYIGSLMMERLRKAGHEPTGTDVGFFKDALFFRGFKDEAIPADIRTLQLKNLGEFDAIIHLSALSNDPMGNMNPGLTEEINHLASARLAKLAKEAGVKRFVFASSCSMYGVSDGSALTEESPQNPVTAYAISKVKTENALHELADTNFSPVYMRNATAYGVSPRIRLDLVLNNLTAWAYLTGEVKILSDGSPWRPIVHISDISKAAILAMEADRELVHDQAFNVGANSENFQIRDIAETVAKTVPGSKVIFGENKDPDARTYHVNFDKIVKTLGFRNDWNMEKGAKELYEAYKENNLTLKEFESGYFTRIKTLELLKQEGKLSDDLYWKGI